MANRSASLEVLPQKSCSSTPRDSCRHAQAGLAPLFTTYAQPLASAEGLTDGASGHDGSAAAAAGGGLSPAGRAVLAHLRKLEGGDGWRGVNRALLHGLLFAAWAETSGLQRPAAAPADDFAPGSDWRLSTGETAFMTP